MSQFASAVNQKTVYAELLLREAERAGENRHLRQAMLQGAATHLEHAYRLYLAEIGDNYQCREPARLTDLWILIANLQLQGKNPSETNEIYNLLDSEESWLSRLQACAAWLASPPEPSSPSAPADPNRIPAFSTDARDDWSKLDPAQIDAWISAFREMLERHRQSMVEW